MQPTFTDTLIDPAPPYTAATATARTEATTSSYEMEEDDIFDFKFNDDAHTQPYLSLGLTPLSQLSPPDTGTTSSTGEYFFPSMPPPVTPLGSSVFSISGSSSSAGPVDSPFQLGNGNMMMPEANPVMGDSAIRRAGRRSKHEVSMQSQGYAIKLEPVPEQSCSLDDSFRDVYSNPLNTESSSSSSAEDPSYQLLHPEMNKLPTHLRRTTGKTRRKSGTRRITDEEEEEEEEMMIWNQGSVDFPVKLSREENSPRQEGRKLRQQLREQELVRQKEKLRQKHLEEEKAHLAHQTQRAAQIAQDYGSTHQREVNIDQMMTSHKVLEQAMHFEAQAQLGSHLSVPTHYSSKNEASNYIVNTSNQFSVL